MENSDFQTLSIKIQNFKKNFDQDVLEPEPKIDFHEIQRLDEILKRIKLIEKRIQKLDIETDRQFILKGNYYFKFILIFGCSWFLFGNIVSIHWFGLLGISLFLSILSFWFLIANERRGKLNIDKKKVSENNSLKNEINFWMIQKREAEQKFKIEELNSEFIEICLRDYQFWEQHENERKILSELIAQRDILKKELV